MKTIEINRIYKCFIEKDYENIYHTNIDTVLITLIGFDEKDTEVNKYNPVKKNHATSTKQVRFFVHKKNILWLIKYIIFDFDQLKIIPVLQYQFFLYLKNL